MNWLKFNICVILLYWIVLYAVCECVWIAEFQTNKQKCGYDIICV